MPRRPDPDRPLAETPDDAAPAPAADGAGTPDEPDARASAPSLAGLGVAGLSRRRVAWAGLVIAAAWIVVGFAGQAAEASRAGARLAAEEALTAAAVAETASLRRERALVVEERWILQQARAYQLGTTRERPFALDPATPSLPPDAPGSAVRRVGAQPEDRTPLESWLDVLFGRDSD